MNATPTDAAKLAHKAWSGDFFPSLDGLRGIAVLSVVIAHTAYFNPISSFQRMLSCFSVGGRMGVQIFFVLSGFLISHSVFKTADKFNCFSYSARRFGKIAPPFVLAVFVFAWLCYFWKGPSNIIASVFAYLTTAAHFTSGWAKIDSVCWTLFIEIHFYILFPLIYFTVRRFISRAEWLTFFIFLIVPVLFRASTYCIDPPVEKNLYLLHLFPRALDNFALGICFSIFYLNADLSSQLASRAKILAPLGVILLVATYCAYACLKWRNVIIGEPSLLLGEVFRYLPEIATFLLLFSIFLPPSHFLMRFLCWRPLTFIGIVSYEWYLFHQPPTDYLQATMNKSFGNVSVYLARILIPFVGTFLISCAIYFFYSAPILASIKKRLMFKSPPSANSSAR